MMTEEKTSVAQKWAKQLVSEMDLTEALAVTAEVATILRGLVEERIGQLTVALGQPETPWRRERRAPLGSGITPAEALERVVGILERAGGEALSVAAIVERSGATRRQVTEALKQIPRAIMVGRKYALKAGA